MSITERRSETHIDIDHIEYYFAKYRQEEKIFLQLFTIWWFFRFLRLYGGQKCLLLAELSCSHLRL